MAGRKAIKKCYYEILGIEQNASDEVIRKNYKLLALKYHPDKNMDNLAEATEMFRSVQEAYEVLTNPQERAWYDKHRSAILAGLDKDSIADSCFDIFPYFTSSCYSGYEDSEEGFYTVYRYVFDEIIKEDTPYYEEDFVKPMSFGYSTTPYQDVHQFYSFWDSYSTPKTFAFLDLYKTMEAPNRRIVRLMEKENKKIRDAAKKKRNEEIRALVAFVKRRDKRVEAHKKLVEVKLEEKRKKSAEHRKKQLAERRKEAESYKESNLFSVADLEEELKNIEENFAEYDDAKKKKKKNRAKTKDQVLAAGKKTQQNEQDDGQSTNNDPVNCDQDYNENKEDSETESLENCDLYCMACEKLFKSVKSFENHENSKKHKINVAALKVLLEQEDQSLENNSELEDNEDGVS